MSSRLPRGWETRPLEDICDRVSVGHVGETSSFFAKMGGVPFIRSQNVRPSKIVLSDIKFITHEFHRKSKKSQLKGGDLLIVRVGQNRGDCAVLPHNLGELNCANIVFARPKPSYSDFLGGYFNTPIGHEALLSLSSGSAQLVLNTKSIAKLEVPVPPPNEALAIGTVSKLFDHRIALLRETNTTLEAIGHALFKSWFVDFDPVRAKQDGRVPDGMDEATAALFPDSFEESALGVVPKGWQASTVGQSFVLTMGQSPPGDTYNEVGDGLPFYQGRTDFGFRFPKQRVYCTAPTRLAKAGDTLVSVRAPVGDVNVAIDSCALGRGVAGVCHPDGHQSYVFYSLHRLKPQFDVYNGEGTVFGSINKKDFQGLPVVLPDGRVLEIFESLVAPLDALVERNEQKLRTLTELRDALLPRLISGQLRLPCAVEEIVGIRTGT